MLEDVLAVEIRLLMSAADETGVASRATAMLLAALAEAAAESAVVIAAAGPRVQESGTWGMTGRGSWETAAGSACGAVGVAGSWPARATAVPSECPDCGGVVITECQSCGRPIFVDDGAHLRRLRRGAAAREPVRHRHPAQARAARSA